MQFTSLHDKNGKEIWEGDIMRLKPFDEEEVTAEVVWLRGAFDIRWTSPESWLGKDEAFLNTFLKTTEIIGNIYENKELFK